MTELFPETIETDRLSLEAATIERCDPFELYEIYSSDRDLEDVLQYVPLDPYETVADPATFLEQATESFRESESVTYLIRPREGEEGAGLLAGTTTLFVDWSRRVGAFAIVLRKRFWGRGYSGERAAALLSIAFDRLDLETVAVSCVAENERSRRAIARYVDAHGGRYEGRLRNGHSIDGDPVDLHRFTVGRDEYRERQE